jgi:hypothetical protein
MHLAVRQKLFKCVRAPVAVMVNTTLWSLKRICSCFARCGLGREIHEYEHVDIHIMALASGSVPW